MDRLSDDELSALARLLAPDRRLTAMVLRDAGFSAELLPSGARTSLEYWSVVNDLIVDGLLADGRARLLAAVATHFPHHPVLRPDRPAAWRVLFLGASPRGLAGLRPDRELRELLALPGLEVTYRPAAAATDLAAVRTARPHVLHLACHGHGPRLTFEDPGGEPQSVHAADLAETLALYAAGTGARLRGIVLSCCTGGEAAALLAPHADEVIAHRDDLDDNHAVRFSQALYRTLPETGSLVQAARLAAADLVLADPALRPLRDGLTLHPAAADARR
ncbi:CHAT domain-containing protein [Dactylosporangium sp. NPDC049525]|uniref:CHAT domain-containing protein n=1 Tax=Dactylosporangium sp. NPDC049525 TaxID=3154730 RepID=UPI00343CCD50